MMSASIATEVFNGYSRYLVIEKMDDESIRRAKEKFLKLRADGVIIHGDYDDDLWVMSNEKHEYRIKFRVNEQEYISNTQEWTGCSYACFCDCIKTFIVFRLGMVELSSISQICHTLCTITEQKLDMAIENVKDKYILESFLSLLPADTPYIGELIERLQEIKFSENIKGNSRKLPDFASYFKFNDCVKEAWKLFDKEKKIYYFPIYFWWNLTAILPLRVTEFILTPRDCLSMNGSVWKLTVRRTKLKKGSGQIHYKVSKDYDLNSYEIPDWMANEVLNYINATADDAQSELGTLFVPIDGSKYRYLTYVQLQNRLGEFLETMMGDRKYPVRLGDTRHIAMINLILSGGSPVICRELAGHESVEVSSNYYANLSGAVETIVYEHFKRGKGEASLNGSLRFSLSRPADAIPVEGGWCDYNGMLSGDISECIKSYDRDYGLGDCRNCLHFYPKKQGLLLEIAKERKYELDEDSKFLIRMIDVVRKGKGFEENIAAALARVQTDAYKYASAYNKLLIKEERNGATEKK